MNLKTIVAFFAGLALLTGCASAAPAAGSQAKAGNTTQSFSDPFAYCAAVGTIDQPDARYTGPKNPEAVLKGLMKASGAAADIPLDTFSQGTFWRCMDQKVYACFVGANLPCESKANTSKEPSGEMNSFCEANPSSDFIPAAVAGHESIYAWACKEGKAVAGDPVFQVDTQGYIREIWYALSQ